MATRILAEVALQAAGAIKGFQQLAQAGDAALKDLATGAQSAGQKIAAAMKTAEASLKKFGDSAQEAGRKMRNVGAIMSVGVTAPVLLLGKSFLTAASDAQEAASAFNFLFGDSATSVRAWADEVAQSMGRSTLALQDMAAGFQKLFGQVTDNKAAAQLSQDFTVLAQDLASFFNVTEDEALQRLQAGLIGSSESVRTFGIFISDSAVAQKALELGIEGVNGQLTDQQKILIRAALIMEQTTAAQGDATRTADSFANKLKRLNGAWRDLSVQLGELILPLAIKLVDALQTLLEWFTALPEGIQQTVLVIAGLIAIIGPLLVIIGSIVLGLGLMSTGFGMLAGSGAAIGRVFLGIGRALTFLVTSLGSGLISALRLAAGSFGLLLNVLRLVLAIGASLVTWPVAVGVAIVALAALIYSNWDGIVSATQSAWDTVAEYALTAAQKLQDGWNTIGEFFTGLWALVVQGAQVAWQGLVALAQTVVLGVQAVWNLIPAFFVMLWEQIRAAAASAWAGVVAVAAMAVEQIKVAWDGLVGIVQSVADAVMNVWTTVAGFFDALWQQILAAAQAVWDGVAAVAAEAVAAVQDAWNGVTEWFTGLWNSAIEQVKQAWASFVTWFQSTIVGQLISYIDSAIAAVRRLIAAVRELISAKSQAQSSGGGGYAQGGPVFGPGTSTSDSIPARLSAGEFVIRAAAVKKYGVRLFHMLNSMALKGIGPESLMQRFAKGGPVIKLPSVSNMIPRFNMGGLVPQMAFAHGGEVEERQSTNVLNLTIDGQTFRNMIVPDEVADQLVKFSMSRQVSSAGRKPGWY